MEMDDIDRVAKVIEHLRKHVNKDLPSQHIAILLAVIQSPGITMPELITQLNMPQGTLSRNVKLLSRHIADDNGRSRLKGHDLLRTEPAKAGRHALAVFLTENGKFLMREIQDIMSEGSPQERHDAEDVLREASAC